MASDAFSSSDFTVGRIADETIATVRNNFQYFVAVASLGWIVHETLDLMIGRQHLFAPTFAHVHSASWMFELLGIELESTIRSAVSAAIILRSYASLRKMQLPLRTDWRAIVQSIPSFALYAMIFTAAGSIFVLLPNTALVSDSWLFLIIIFLFLAVLLVIALAWSVVVPLIAVKRLGLLAAIYRSDLMTRRRRGTIFLAGALLTIALFIPQVAISIALHQKLLSEPLPSLFSLLGIVRAVASILDAIFSGAGVGIIYILLSQADQDVGSHFPSQ